MTLSCSVCGGDFEGRADARYCSPACRQKASRARADEDGKAFSELPDDEQARLRASIGAFLERVMTKAEAKRKAAGLPPLSEAQRRRREAVTLRNLAIQATSIPVPSTGIFGKGEPGTGNSVVAFDPATGEPARAAPAA